MHNEVCRMDWEKPVVCSIVYAFHPPTSVPSADGTSLLPIRLVKDNTAYHTQQVHVYIPSHLPSFKIGR